MVSDSGEHGVDKPRRKTGRTNQENGTPARPGGPLEAVPDLEGQGETKQNKTDAHYHFLLEFCHTHPGSHEPKPAHWREHIEHSPEPGTHDINPAMQEFLRSREGFGMKKGLENVRALLDRLGLLHAHPPVILVAGTNGKGTAATAIAESLATVGYRPGLYTSPHVERFLERIQVMSGDPDDDVLETACRRVIAATNALDQQGVHATYFEVATALALEVFKRHHASPWVLEVGMGGRLDAVNALTPILSVITGIGSDHKQHLGEDTAQRAREKAGIMRPGVPCFTAAQGPALDALQAHATTLGTPLVSVVSRDTVVRPESALRSLVRAALSDPRVVTRLDRLAQWEPASLVLPRLPARHETWRFPGGARVLLDVAHNPEAFEALAQRIVAFDAPPEKRVLLAGLLDDKDPAAVARLAQGFHRVVTTRPDSARAMEADRLAHELETAGIEAHRITCEPETLAALQAALRATPPDGLLVVAGSFYLAGTIRPALREVAQRG